MPNNYLFEERELLLRIAEGDEHAFGVLYKHFAPKIFSAAMSYTGRDTALCEDIVQVLFTKIWISRSKLATIDNISNYLFIAARNILFDSLKQKSAYRALHTGNLGYQSNSQLFTIGVEQKEFDLLFERAVSSLPPQQQAVYRLARIDELSHEQIAEQLNLKLSTVRTHLKLAVRTVRTFIASHLSGPAALFLWMATNLFFR